MVRYLFGTSQTYRAFRVLVLEHWDELGAAMLFRRTQTNEVGRCATLVPLLAQLAQRWPCLRLAPALSGLAKTSDCAGCGTPSASLEDVPDDCGALLFSRNGQPIAWAEPHGAWLDWL